MLHMQKLLQRILTTGVLLLSLLSLVNPASANDLDELVKEALSNNPDLA